MDRFSYQQATHCPDSWVQGQPGAEECVCVCFWEEMPETRHQNIHRIELLRVRKAASYLKCTVRSEYYKEWNCQCENWRIVNVRSTLLSYALGVA